jgi:hypothetical protein
MNLSRVALAAVVVFVVDQIYGFLVWGTLLMPEFERYPAVFRSKEAVMSHLPLMMAGGLIAAFALAYIYAKGYEGGTGIGEGLRFGCLIGTFMFGAISIGNYAVMNYGRKLAVESAVAAFAEAVVMGLVLGLTYKAATPVRASRV